MSSLLLLIPLSILVLIGAGLALLWSIERGLYEDMDTPALLPLLDRDEEDVDSRKDP